MNPIDNEQTGIAEDRRLLDRLVDGELPERERRELLLRIEKEPDGWRRCALAFLEAQIWRQALATAAGTDELPGRCVVLTGETPVLGAVHPALPGERQGRWWIVWR